MYNGFNKIIIVGFASSPYQILVKMLFETSFKPPVHVSLIRPFHYPTKVCEPEVGLFSFEDYTERTYARLPKSSELNLNLQSFLKIVTKSMKPAKI